MSAFPAPSFDHYWTMWNEPDVDLVRGHLDQAVSEDFIFCDPVHFHVGRDALEANVRGLRSEHPRVAFSVASGIDSHHNRVRYEWHMTMGARTIIRGFDVATTSDDGLIERIDGFFGKLPNI